MVFGILIKIISTDNQEFGKLLDLFSKITYKGDKINLDYGSVSLKSLLSSKLLFSSFQSYICINIFEIKYSRRFTKLLYI